MDKVNIEKKLNELDKEQRLKFENALKDAGINAVINLSRRLLNDNGTLLNMLITTAKNNHFSQITEYAKKIVSIEDEEIEKEKEFIKNSTKNTLINILKYWKRNNYDISKITTNDYKDFFAVIMGDSALALPLVKVSDDKGNWLNSLKVSKEYLSTYKNYFVNLTDEREEGDIYIQRPAQLLKKKNEWVIGSKGRLGLISPNKTK